MMRFIILVLVYFIPVTSVFSQNFSLPELIKINNYTIDDFDTYVTQKGYKYYQNNNEDFANATSYVFYVNNIRRAYVSKFYYKTQSKEMISFQTGSSSAYLEIKSELKTLGFKFIDTETHEGTTFLNYARENWEVSLASSTHENDYKEKLTTYEISVAKRPKK